MVGEGKGACAYPCEITEEQHVIDHATKMKIRKAHFSFLHSTVDFRLGLR